jgi:hypothetical protein
VPEVSLSNSVPILCGASCVIVLGVSLLALAGLLSARTADVAAERGSALFVALFALLLSVSAFWSASGGLESLGGAAADVGRLADQLARSIGLSAAVFQVQTSLASVLIAVLAWRYPGRE